MQNILPEHICSSAHCRCAQSYYCYQYYINCAVLTGEAGVEAELNTVEAIVQHYQAVQQSNAVLQPSNAANKDKRTDSGEEYYSNGTPAERYWSSMGSENNSKRQNVSALLQTIFPGGLGPLASKVAKIERKEQARASRQAARQAGDVRPGAADGAAADSCADLVVDHATGIAIRSSSSVPVVMANSRSSSKLDGAASTAAAQQTASLRRGTQSQTLLPPQGVEGVSVCGSEAHARTSGLASGSSGAFADRRTVSDAASAFFRTSAKPHQEHYTRGQKLAATMLWEAASGKSQPVRLRQCLTYSEIRMKNLAAAEMPLSRIDLQEPAA